MKERKKADVIRYNLKVEINAHHPWAEELELDLSTIADRLGGSLTRQEYEHPRGADYMLHLRSKSLVKSDGWVKRVQKQHVDGLVYEVTVAQEVPLTTERSDV